MIDNLSDIILKMFFNNMEITYISEYKIKKLKDIDDGKMFLIRNNHDLILKVRLENDSHALCFNINKIKIEIISLNIDVHRAINIFGKYEI